MIALMGTSRWAACEIAEPWRPYRTLAFRYLFGARWARCRSSDRGRVCAPDHPPLIVPLPVTDLVTWAGLPV
jgi:hypothetical protein